MMTPMSRARGRPRTCGRAGGTRLVHRDDRTVTPADDPRFTGLKLAVNGPWRPDARRWASTSMSSGSMTPRSRSRTSAMGGAMHHHDVPAVPPPKPRARRDPLRCPPRPPRDPRARCGRPWSSCDPTPDQRHGAERRGPRPPLPGWTPRASAEHARPRTAPPWPPPAVRLPTTAFAAAILDLNASAAAGALGVRYVISTVRPAELR